MRKDLGHETFPLPPFNVDEKIERIGDIAADRLVGKLNARLQDAGGKACDGLPGGVGVNRGQAFRNGRC